MRQHLFAVVLVSAVSSTAWAGGSWVFQPSTYSHDYQTGERVARYAAKPPVYGPSDPSYEQSAYIHKRTALRGAAGSVERRHYVETWGAGEYIRPYGEWQRPFRAGATPFGPWGNPSGPWTTPFGSWVNPYGLGKLPNPPWYPWYPYPGYPAARPPYRGHPGSEHSHPGRNRADVGPYRHRDQTGHAYGGRRAHSDNELSENPDSFGETAAPPDGGGNRGTAPQAAPHGSG